jgi:beta-lactamase superfamily II metal-dependent hydrolase
LPIQIDLWDVGQGDCSVIRLPDGELIIIDVGPTGSPLVDWLLEPRRQDVRIKALILTHNDADHAAALVSIIPQRKASIGGIWMLRDRPTNDRQFQRIFRCAEQVEREGHFKIRGITDETVFWSNGDISLLAIYPSFSENVDASRPNLTSGMIALMKAGQMLALWPGDAPLLKVRDKLNGTNPFLLDGPHHGAPVDYKSNRGQMKGVIDSIRPSRSFISVGTNNQWSHPRPSYLELLASRRARVVCSQLTFNCEREAVKQNRKVFKGSEALGLRPCRSGVSCRGSMRFTLCGDALVPDEFDAQHLQRVQHLKRPRCLRGCGWRKGDSLPTF